MCNTYQFIRNCQHQSLAIVHITLALHVFDSRGRNKKKSVAAF